MTLKAYSFLVFVVLSSSFSYSQLIIKEAEFTPKTILSKIFQGEFQNDQNAQKWPVSSVQALEMDTYLDAKHFAYTSVDTIINFQLDTNQYKIVVFTTFQVDSSGRIQEYMFSQIQIGMAYFEKRESNFNLIKFNTNVSNTTHGSRPKSRIEEIGVSKFALVLKEEIVQDCGREYWFEIFKEGCPLFLTYDYMSYVPTEISYIIQNSIEIVKTENEYFDLIVQTKKIPTDIIDTAKASKIKPLKTKLSPGLNDKILRVQFPFGYSVKP